MADRQNREGQNRVWVERRKGKDWVGKALSVFSIAGWILAGGTLLFLESARPDEEDLFSRLLGLPVRSYWNTTLLWIALGLLILVAVVCVAGFFFNVSRHKRKTDKYRKSILFLGVLSFLGIALFLMRFGSYL